MSMKVVTLAVLGAVALAAAAAGGYRLGRPHAALTAQDSERTLAAVPSPPVAADPAPQVAPARDPGAPVAEPSLAPVVMTPVAAIPKARQAAPKAAVSARPADPVAVVNTPPPVPPAPVPEPAVADVKDVRPEAPPPAVEARLPRIDEVTVAPDSVIGIRLDTTISSETARVEDRVTARVTRDVSVDGHVAISSGARLEGVVAVVEQGGRLKDRPRLGVRFQSLVLADGTRLTIQTETIFRDGESPSNSAASKMGASAAVGGILGAILGGKKGAAIGSTVGAAGGTAAVMSGALPSVRLPAGTPLTVRLTAPLHVSIERQDQGSHPLQ
jgi:hypothetical protein